jgi:hypothetical protein
VLIAAECRMFLMALAGTRDENPVVDQGMVQRDVQALHSAGVGKIGTVSKSAGLVFA